ncbi:MAG: hypothetical protein IT236_16085 [Bacteroidia bacterium]|nr:hypothetical protein [Bacteroidia bacterium]
MKLQVHFVLLLLFSISCDSSPKKNNLNLSNKHLQSQFYYYQNDYYFTSNSGGYLKRGQKAWSFLMDTTQTTTKSDAIIYTDSVSFTYILNDSLLQVLSSIPDSKSIDTLVYSVQTDMLGNYYFQSVNEYTYGKENITFITGD